MGFKEGKYDILAGQVDKIQMAWDLSLADITYFISNSFSNEKRSQVEMRTTNMNKSTPVELRDLCTVGSPDEDVVDCLKGKQDYAGPIIDRTLQRYR
jgi:hypothetical protein